MDRIGCEQSEIEPPQLRLCRGNITRGDLHPLCQPPSPQIEIGEVNLSGLPRDLAGPDAARNCRRNSAAAKSLTIKSVGPVSRKASARALNGSIVSKATRILASR
jgi:hypothetical protein